jgi:hypothetical protein
MIMPTVYKICGATLWRESQEHGRERGEFQRRVSEQRRHQDQHREDDRDRRRQIEQDRRQRQDQPRFWSRLPLFGRLSGALSSASAFIPRFSRNQRSIPGPG